MSKENITSNQHYEIIENMLKFVSKFYNENESNEKLKESNILKNLGLIKKDRLTSDGFFFLTSLLGYVAMYFDKNMDNIPVNITESKNSKFLKQLIQSNSSKCILFCFSHTENILSCLVIKRGKSEHKIGECVHIQTPKDDFRGCQRC